MYTFFIEFKYETKAGTLLNGKMECLDFDDVAKLIISIYEWCDDQGYKINAVNITRLGKAEL